jgi:hypothetical protein
LFLTVAQGGHSNTERGYLTELRERLEQELSQTEGELLGVKVSQADKDPLVII